MKTEHRNALLAHIFDLQLKKAKKLIDEQFREPLKEFLMGLPAQMRRDGMEVGELVKAYIQEDRAHETIDGKRVVDDFKAATANGTLSHTDLLKLVEDGVISVANPDVLGKLLVDRGVSSGYTIKVPGGGRPALKILTLDEGKLKGVEDALGRDSDLTATIIKAATVPLPKVTGKVALQRP